METATIGSLVEGVSEEVVGWRRHLHRNPELSFHEEETSRFVYETLESFGGLELSRPTPTSVLARLVGGAPGRVIALRADVDALPITEENDSEFVSRNPGVMHACGHDGHTAMLLGAAKVLAGMKGELRGEVRFVFQHAEELFPGGAEEMVRAGVMDGVDRVVGIHLWSGLPAGKVGVVYGPMMAAPDTFKIVVKGKGGHAALPHQTVDSIAVGAQVVTNLQHVVSRETDPIENVVVSVTKFTGGTAHNVIPGSVEMIGTVRTLKPEIRDGMPGAMERVVRGITQAHGAEYEFEYQRGYRPVINDDEVTRAVEETARDVLGEATLVRMPPTMGGEDFSAYGQVSPGTFYLVGARNEEKGISFPHHHPRFDIDEDALPVGVKMHVGAALRLLEDAS
ncbi:M20 family metallopeptidase [Rubrobacter marinus]|uniref:M20 family metallopeptidase n=1 Tax=Rubrobacter marinus TaxID=2653852 RepID=UPI00389A4E1D